MAAKETNRATDDDEDRVVAITPSDLDDKTHREMDALYKESTETLRFIKNHQWRTVGATLLTYLGMIFIAGFVDADKSLTNKLMAITILLSASVIFTLTIYQFWMHNEMAKIDRLSAHMSSLFREVRSQKSKREGNLHRFTLLSFMMITVVLGAVVVHLALTRVSGG